jgi:UPF0271 protein
VSGRSIDLNCDLGEGAGNDEAVMPFVSSASIACGFHAGDPTTIYRTLVSARLHGVRVGAHPSYPDRENFGRREMKHPPPAILRDCLYQIAGLAALAKAAGAMPAYVKPHGALYNAACRDAATAGPVVEAAEQFELPVMGLPGSMLEKVAAERGHIGFIAEGFADRRYNADGSLVSRDLPGAFVESPTEAAEQAARLIRERGVRSLCVHGDNPQALEFVKALRAALEAAGFEIRAGR